MVIIWTEPNKEGMDNIMADDETVIDYDEENEALMELRMLDNSYLDDDDDDLKEMEGH